MRGLKKVVRVLFLFLCIMAASEVCQAKKLGGEQKRMHRQYGTVRMSLKSGTLTISGKGKVSIKMEYGKPKLVKKVIVKEGITSLPDYFLADCKKLSSITLPSTIQKLGRDCFYGTAITELTIPAQAKAIGQNVVGNCRKMKKLTMPGKFKMIFDSDSDSEEYDLMMGTALKQVTFNTDLSIRTVTALNTSNLYVKKGDKKYKSIKGVIYSKNGEDIVRMPRLRKELKVEEGCKNFCLQSILYCNYDGNDTDESSGCWSLKKVVIPSSVVKVDRNKYAAELKSPYDWALGSCFNLDNVSSLQCANKNLDMDSVLELIHAFPKVGMDRWMRLIPERITLIDGYYVLDKVVLLGSQEGRKEVVVPDGIRIIDEYAFCQDTEIQSVRMPDTVEEVREAAFYYCDNLKELQLSPNLKIIKELAFANTAVEQVEMPDSIVKMDYSSFSPVEEEDLNPVLSYTVNPERYRTFITVFSDGYQPWKRRICWFRIQNVTGYEIEASTSPDYRKIIKKSTAGPEESYKDLKIKAKYKKLYIRIRPYTKVNGVNVYGIWQGQKCRND